MTSPKTYDGSCFCGAVQFTVIGAPVSMGYCHCNSCRHWSAASQRRSVALFRLPPGMRQCNKFSLERKLPS